jgi:hypothetical protein
LAAGPRGYLAGGPLQGGEGGLGVRIVAVVAVIWLLIGLVAAGQRDYFKGGPENCAHAARVVLTVVAGPLNYMGVNPKVNCKPPQPSK